MRVAPLDRLRRTGPGATRAAFGCRHERDLRERVDDLVPPDRVAGTERRRRRERTGQTQLAVVHSATNPGVARRQQDPVGRDTDGLASGLDRGGHRHLIDPSRETTDHRPLVADRCPGRVACDIGCSVARTDHAEPRLRQRLRGPGEEQERRTRCAQPLAQQCGEACVERRDQRDPALQQPLLLERERRRRVEQCSIADRLVVFASHEFDDADHVDIEQISRVDLTDELPELARWQWLRVERHQPVREQRCRSNGRRHRRPADDASDAGWTSPDP